MGSFLGANAGSAGIVIGYFAVLFCPLLPASVDRRVVGRLFRLAGFAAHVGHVAGPGSAAKLLTRDEDLWKYREATVKA